MLAFGLVFFIWGKIRSMLRIVETGEILEIQDRMSPRKRTFLLLLSLLHLFALYQLLLRSEWLDYLTPFFITVVVISIGALMLSGFLILAGIVGINSLLYLNKPENHFIYIAGAPFVPIRKYEYPIGSMGKSQGTPLLAAGRNGPASPAYGCVKLRLAFSLESPLDESWGQASEIKLKSFPSEAPGLDPGRFTLSFEIERHEWDEGSSHTSLMIEMEDGRRFNVGSSWSRSEIEEVSERVNLFLDLG